MKKLTRCSALDRPNYSIRLERVEDGEIVDYTMKHTDDGSALFQWRENNWSCDCNRIMDFERAKGTPENVIDEMPLVATGMCISEGRYRCVYMKNPDGETIYSEPSPGERLMELMKRRREIEAQLVPEHPEDRFRQHQAQLRDSLRGVNAEIESIMERERGG